MGIAPGADGSLAPSPISCSDTDIMGRAARIIPYAGVELAERAFEGVAEEEVARREASAARQLELEHLQGA